MDERPGPQHARRRRNRRLARSEEGGWFSFSATLRWRPSCRPDDLSSRTLERCKVLAQKPLAHEKIALALA